MILSTATAALARRDVTNYVQLLQAKGGTSMTAADQQLLRTFVEELYSRVGRQDFITLRSSQNMGTGVVAYTLHGRPCILANGPTWGADSVSFNAGGKFLTIPWAGVQPNARMLVGSFATIQAFQVIADSTVPARQITFAQTNNIYTNAGLNVAGPAIVAAGQPFFVLQNFDGASSSIGVNGNAGTTGNTGTNSYNDLVVGADFGGGASISSDASFVCAASGTVSQPHFADIYAAYKATIGQGISLP